MLKMLKKKQQKAELNKSNKHYRVRTVFRHCAFLLIPGREAVI